MANLEIKKRVDNAILYTNGMIKLENVRASYPHLHKPYAGKDSKNDKGQPATPKFGIVAMLPKKTHVQAKDLIVAEMNALLALNDNAKVSRERKFCRNGDDEANESYAGFWIASAREERRPSVRNKRGELITEPDKVADMIYGGCWVSVLIRPWFQDGRTSGAGFGKRINAGLQGVQFIRDDEPFGEGRIDDTAAWGNEDNGDGPASDRDAMDSDDL